MPPALDTQNNNPMTPIEETMLRGISVRLMATIIGATITICLTFAGTYYNFQAHLKSTDDKVLSHDKTMESMQTTDRSLQQDQQNTRIQVNMQDVRINDIQRQISNSK